jgi:very-short-patch-repair endonuclease
MNDFARTLRSAMTEAERLLWSRLRRRQVGGFRFRRQVPVGGYICDFICPQARLVLELDGSQHFERSDYDERRTAFLERRGYRVLRFWNIDVLKHVDQVLEAINAALVDPSMSGRLD